MTFKYIEHDPMDEVKIDPVKAVLTFIGCLAYLAIYLCAWCAFYGWRP